MPVAADSLLDGLLVEGVHPYHKKQRHKHSRACAQRASHSAAGGPQNLPRLVHGNLHGPHSALYQRAGRSYAHQSVCKLLQYLGHGGLHHAAVALKVSPKHPQNSVQKNGGGKSPQHLRSLRLQDKAQHNKSPAGHQPYCRHIDQSALKHPMRIPILPQTQLLSDHLGYGRRDTVGGNHQNDSIIGMCRLIVSKSQITDDTMQRAPIEEPYDSADNSRKGKDARLYYKAISCSAFIRHILNLSANRTFPDTWPQTHARKSLPPSLCRSSCSIRASYHNKYARHSGSYSASRGHCSW